MASWYDSESMSVGHAARVRTQHPVDVGPDVNLVGAEQISEDRGREVAAVASERRLQTLHIARDEPGDNQGGRRIPRRYTFGIRPRLRPPYGRSERAPLDLDHLPRIHPVHRAGPARDGGQIPHEKAR
jgi:hypothetical protein